MASSSLLQVIFTTGRLFLLIAAHGIFIGYRGARSSIHSYDKESNEGALTNDKDTRVIDKEELPTAGGGGVKAAMESLRELLPDADK